MHTGYSFGRVVYSFFGIIRFLLKAVFLICLWEICSVRYPFGVFPVGSVSTTVSLQCFIAWLLVKIWFCYSTWITPVLALDYSSTCIGLLQYFYRITPVLEPDSVKVLHGRHKL